MHDLVVRHLEQARNRTLELTDLDDPTLVTQHDPLMSPLVWDLAHVSQQEELWLLRAGLERPLFWTAEGTRRRFGVEEKFRRLSILRTGGGVVVASEPCYDDPGWADVPDHHLVGVADGVVTVTELEA
jgi:predicted glutamine amidotransferase